METAGKTLDEIDALARDGRLEEAERSLSRLAEAGDPTACFKLADWCYRGVGMPTDFARARKLFGAAADGGIEIAGHIVTNMMASGAGGPRDWREALARLEAEAATAPNRRRTLETIAAMDLTPDGDPVATPDEQVVSQSPYIGAFTDLLTTDECGYLAYVAQHYFERSTIRDKATGRQYPDPVRTSDQATFHWAIEDPALHAINRRIAAVTKSSTDQGEPLQVFRYAVGQEFRRHVDADPNRENVRILTLLVYLNDDYEGGETLFTRTGMTVRGGTGDAIYFRNTLPSGEVDLACEHAGLPVTRGQKLLASRWICQSVYDPDALRGYQ